MATLAAVFWNLLGLVLLVGGILGAVLVRFIASAGRVQLTNRELAIGYSACAAFALIGLLLLVFK